MIGCFGGRYPPWVRAGEAVFSAVGVTHNFTGEAAVI